jgi:hypothetical protein
MIIFVVLMGINSAVFMRLSEEAPWMTTLLPFYGWVMMASGLIAGIFALLALIIKHERSILVWLPILVGLFVIFFIIGDLLIPH